MLKFKQAETDKHSIKILLQRKNLLFLRHTHQIQSGCMQGAIKKCVKQNSKKD